MKAMILAAGLGSRLRPWTLYHPKALVPVGGIPMLERVIRQLNEQGFDKIIVNVHHFADQIIDFLQHNEFGKSIAISDEREQLLDTGGGIIKASEFLCADDKPFLIHNVDILSTANLGELMHAHEKANADATLLVSERESSRRLAVDVDQSLHGWKDLSSGKTRPADFIPSSDDRLLAFSGIHVLSTRCVDLMRQKFGNAPFPIMDFYLDNISGLVIRCEKQSFDFIDIGKPETLAKANRLA